MNDAPDLPTDAMLVAQLGHGQSDALGVIFDRYGFAAFHLAHRMLGEVPAAEDVVHEVFLALWTNPASAAATPTRIRAWLMNAVHERCRARQRSVHPVHPHAPAIRDPEGMPALFATDAREMRRADVRSVLDRLSLLERLPLELMLFYGWHPSKVAAYLGLSVATMNARLRLTMDELRTILGVGTAP